MVIDVITAQVLKAGVDPMVANKKFNTVYDTEKTPKDCARMMVTKYKLLYKKTNIGIYMQLWV